MKINPIRVIRVPIKLNKVLNDEVSDTTDDATSTKASAINYITSKLKFDSWEEYLKLEKPPCLPGGIEWQSSSPV